MRRYLIRSAFSVFVLAFAFPSYAARLAVFRAPEFPTVDAPAISDATLHQALANEPFDTISSLDALKSGLPGHDTLLLPYGSAFPVDAWPEITSFLRRGGNLVVLGGAPFHEPVRFAGGAWARGLRQPTYAHELLIGPAEPVDARGLGVSLPDPSWSTPIAGSGTVWTLTVRLGTRADLPTEHGSEAHRDGVLRPLVHLADAEGIPRAAPLVEIDRLRGDHAGGRWIFAPTDAPLGADVVRAIVRRAREGASQFDAGPVHASVSEEEIPVIRIVARRPASSDAGPLRAAAVVRNDAGVEVHRAVVALSGPAVTREATLPIRARRRLAPGLYHVDVALEGARWSPSRTTTGFWVRDDALLASGPRLSVSRDWLRSDGKVLPIVGTTYMASDVHRKFLFEPDPHVWDRDFATMAKLGINFVRTGVWTGWSRAMLNSGAIDEGFLRALDAYVQTAAKHGILVNFTFYAFLPPSFGGSNPYLDPRALEGQREFLSTIASRYRGASWIHWDLINEPSYAPPEGLWSNRPIRDTWEARAWRAWVENRHGDDVAQLRDLWRDRGGDPLALPRESDLNYVQIREDRTPRKARDFVEFSQEVVAGWAADLRATLRAAGGDVLVTLGQDEGGTWLRPSQQLHAASVDYTAVHPWWQNDDVLATGVASKVPEKPMLFQETGLMRLEGVDGMPWRSPDLAAETLETKYAYAFASRGAGVVEWAWNINPYMPIDNESVIGFFRPDGTAKPELGVVPSYAEFFRKAAPLLDDFEPDAVIVVIPHSRLFMGRPAATDGFRRMIRMMAERFGVVPTALSELRLTPERLEAAKLVVVPSPEFLATSAAEALLAASRRGTKVLVIGPVTGDPYGRVPTALAQLGVADAGRPVALREPAGGGFATFDRNLRESLLRSIAPPIEARSGNVWHEPLPLDHAREDEPLAALLARAFAAAGIETHPSDTGVAARLLRAPRGVLGVFVNESARDARREMTVGGRKVAVDVPAGRARLVLFDPASGEILAKTD